MGVAAGERASAEELLRDADIAMYRAKWDGKNRYAVFESGMQDSVQERMELDMDLRQALERDEFVLVYQPTFALSDMSPTGVEALIRWRHPTRGTVAPDDVHPRSRGDRADHRGRTVGAARGLPPGGRVARGRTPDRHRRQRLGPPARHTTS